MFFKKFVFFKSPVFSKTINNRSQLVGHCMIFRMSGQICLCRKPVAGIFTKNGLCSFCSFCHFFCTKEDEFICDQAVKKFLATKQPQPLCCMDVVRRHAKMKVVTDVEKESFGRPFFVCSKENDPCNYFAWGDQAIIPRPLCEHGEPCHISSTRVALRASFRQWAPDDVITLGFTCF